MLIEKVHLSTHMSLYCKFFKNKYELISIDEQLDWMLVIKIYHIDTHKGWWARKRTTTTVDGGGKYWMEEVYCVVLNSETHYTSWKYYHCAKALIIGSASAGYFWTLFPIMHFIVHKGTESRNVIFTFKNFMEIVIAEN